MLTREENELLCRVGPETPMGKMMRRYWIPAALSTELEAGGAPRRTRLLGEDLVAFRSPDGTVGVLDENCPHRGASLVLARNEDCGLRCIYHGWKMAADGQIVDMPSEPADSSFAERILARAYPVYEDGGIIWAYLGPVGTEPPRIHFDWMSLPPDHIQITKALEECNWVQTLEGVIDSAHSNVLHTNLIKPAAIVESAKTNDDTSITLRPSDDPAPRIEVENTAYGFRYAAIRRPLVNPETTDYLRVTLFIAPFIAFFPGPAGWTFMQAFVPVDDDHTMFHFMQVKQDGPIDAETRLRRDRRNVTVMGVDLDSNYNKLRTRENNWMQNRAAMQTGDFSGIRGVNNEDMAMHESMGKIYDRSREHLGVSDIAVIRMRRIMLDSVKQFTETGAPPVGLAEPVAYETLHAEERMIPKGSSWQGVLVS
jgi:phthalate 4,5-dioxygenase oxygenase subunit